MPNFAPSFVATQNTSAPTILSLSDDSTGSDVANSTRRVSFKKYDGTFIKNGNSNYFSWPIVDVTVDFDILPKDLALYILVEWLDVSGNVLYMADKYKDCDLNNEEGAYDVCAKVLDNPSIIQDVNYMTGLANLFVLLQSAENAIEIGGDLKRTQQALDQAKLMLDNQNFFF